MSPNQRTQKTSARTTSEGPGVDDIAVLGLSEQGLTFAIDAASRGMRVRGYDLDDVRIAQLETREASFLNDAEIERFKRASDLTLTARADDLKELDAYIISGTVNELLDLVARAGKHLVRGALVVVETRLSPGECERTVIPLLERHSGLSRHEFSFAYAPIPRSTSRRRVIGAMSAPSIQRAIELYRTVLGSEVTPLRSIKEVEAVVLFEDAFIDVGNALINEIAQVFERSHIDMNNILRAADVGRAAFSEWPGLTGALTSPDAYRSIRGGIDKGTEFRLLPAAQRTLSGMPFYIARILTETLRSKRITMRGAPIAILGIGDPLGRTDRRPVHALCDALKKKGAKIRLYDPNFLLESDVRSLTEALSGAKAAVIVEPHAEFYALSADMLENYGVSVVVDAALCLERAQFNASRVLYRGVGR